MFSKLTSADFLSFSRSLFLSFLPTLSFHKAVPATTAVCCHVLAACGRCLVSMRLLVISDSTVLSVSGVLQSSMSK